MYQKDILIHYRNPKNAHDIDNITASAERNNSMCGDHIQAVYFSSDGVTITDISFKAVGCAICTASASMLSEKVKGLDIDKAKELKIADFNALRGVTGSRVKCASLAFEVLGDLLNE